MASYDNLFGVPAVEVLQPSSEAWRNRGPFPVLLTCEHASADLPPGYAWGEDEWLADMHWAVDLGVKELLDELQRPAADDGGKLGGLLGQLDSADVPLGALRQDYLGRRPLLVQPAHARYDSHPAAVVCVYRRGRAQSGGVRPDDR